MTWRDDKLTFLNIMDQGSVNVTNTKDVSSYKQSKLWLPLDRIVHENAVIGEILSGTNAFVRVAANTEAKDPDPKNPNEGNDCRPNAILNKVCYSSLDSIANKAPLTL